MSNKLRSVASATMVTFFALAFGDTTMAGPSMSLIDGGGAGPGTELHLPPPLPPVPAAPSSGAWVRPYTQGDGGVGAMGGYSSHGGTSVTGNVYVPHYGPPAGGASVETHF